MPKTVNHKYGTSTYNPTKLEGFVEKLAKEFDVELSDMRPTQRMSAGPFIERATPEKADPSKITIWYTRNPSDATITETHQFESSNKYMIEITPMLYADKKPRSEFAYINLGKKKVIMEFKGEMKKVTVKSVDLADVITETKKQSSNNTLDERNADIYLDFKGSAPRENRNQKTSVADSKNAFNFVSTYFKS